MLPGPNVGSFVPAGTAVSEPVLRCAGCGAVASIRDRWPWACPERRAGDDIDHVLVPEFAPAVIPSAHENPFVRYRGRLCCYQLWRGAGRDDQSFVALVEALDVAIARVAGRGFRITPLAHFPTLDVAVGARVWVKDETNNVAGSHKGRHLFGVLLLLRVLEELGRPQPGELVIASCGNAARAAAVMAAAAGRHLTAFVPADVDQGVASQLAALGASVERCGRDGQPGDPCYRRFRLAVAEGAIAFSCQGPDNGSAIEGASTIGWEVTEARPDGVDRVVIQVGGGALATALVRGLGLGLGVGAQKAIIDTVQTASAHPLERALSRLRRDPADAARHRSRYMWPWETEPASVARGILDDETYDWLAVAQAMLATGGTAVVASEAALIEANQLARATTGIDVDETGSAGLAGLLMLARSGQVPAGSDALVIFTGGPAGLA